MRLKWITAVGALLSLAAIAGAQAQAFPSRPVRIVVVTGWPSRLIDCALALPAKARAGRKKDFAAPSRVHPRGARAASHFNKCSNLTNHHNGEMLIVLPFPGFSALVKLAGQRITRE